MPKLKNPRWEEFSKLTASGSKRADAYLGAGYSSPKRSEATNRGSKLFHAHPEIEARVIELQTEIQDSALKRAEVNREYVLLGLKENFDRAMEAKPVYDNSGKPTGQYTYNGSVANRSMELVGKEIGMFADRMLVGTLDAEIEGMNPEQLRTVIRTAATEVGLRMVDSTDDQKREWIRKIAPRVGLKVVDAAPPKPPADGEAPSLH